MKALVENCSPGYLNTPDGKPWRPGGQEEIDIAPGLLKDRVEFGLYKVIQEEAPSKPPPPKPRKKRASSKVRATVAAKPKQALEDVFR